MMDSIPDPRWFMFETTYLTNLCDGEWHVLEAGTDYPTGLVESNIQTRLRNMASHRGYSVRTRVLAPGRVAFQATRRTYTP